MTQIAQAGRMRYGQAVLLLGKKYMGFLDFLFPKYCVNCRKLGSYLCESCFTYISFDTNEICVVCNRSAIGGMTHPRCQGKWTLDGAFASIVYQGVVKKLIYHFKYKPYVTDLQHVLSDFLYEGMIQKESFMYAKKHDSVILPIPLHKEKEKRRGYNQAKILADNFGKNVSIPVMDLLLRTKNTPTQVGLPREKRQENLRDAFVLKKNASVSGKTLFLLDDVTTSGATFAQAAKLLKKAGARAVYGIALAKEQ